VVAPLPEARQPNREARFCRSQLVNTPDGLVSGACQLSHYLPSLG
jgi:hypothetical protein